MPAPPHQQSVVHQSTKSKTLLELQKHNSIVKANPSPTPPQYTMYYQHASSGRLAYSSVSSPSLSSCNCCRCLRIKSADYNNNKKIAPNATSLNEPVRISVLMVKFSLRGEIQQVLGDNAYDRERRRDHGKKKILFQDVVCLIYLLPAPAVYGTVLIIRFEPWLLFLNVDRDCLKRKFSCSGKNNLTFSKFFSGSFPPRGVSPLKCRLVY